MARGQHLTGYQQGIVKRYYGNIDAISLQKLGELVSDLAVTTDAKKLGELWQRVHKTLQKTPADQLKASRVVAERNLEALAKMVGELATMKPGAAQAPADAGPRPAAPSAALSATESEAAPAAAKEQVEITPQVLAKALAAFKKRLKMNQLEQDSKLGRSPLTSKGARVTAITPPREYPRAVWDELFARGEIRPVGGGMFELVWKAGKK